MARNNPSIVRCSFFFLENLIHSNLIFAAPKAQRNAFADLPSSPITPPAVNSWVDANLTIKREGVSEQKRCTTVPDPGLFFGVEESARQSAFVRMWDHIRPAWLSAVERGRLPQPTEVWRKILAYQPLEAGTIVQITLKNKAHFDARKLLETTIHDFNSNMSVMPPPDKVIDESSARRLVRELCMINFRAELFYLDSLLDATRPQPNPSTSMAQLDVLRAQHSRTRGALIFAVLGYGSLQPEAHADLGITATYWLERYSAVKSFWAVIDTWDGVKPVIWRRGIDMDLTNLVMQGADWERKIVEFYVQTAYNTLGYPPSFPRRLSQ